MTNGGDNEAGTWPETKAIGTTENGAHPDVLAWTNCGLPFETSLLELKWKVVQEFGILSASFKEKLDIVVKNSATMVDLFANLATNHGPNDVSPAQKSPKPQLQDCGTYKAAKKHRVPELESLETQKKQKVTATSENENKQKFSSPEDSFDVPPPTP